MWCSIKVGLLCQHFLEEKSIHLPYLIIQNIDHINKSHKTAYIQMPLYKRAILECWFYPKDLGYVFSYSVLFCILFKKQFQILTLFFQWSEGDKTRMNSGSTMEVWCKVLCDSFPERKFERLHTETDYLNIVCYVNYGQTVTLVRHFKTKNVFKIIFSFRSVM